MNRLCSGSAAWEAQTLNYRIDLYVEKVPSPKLFFPKLEWFFFSAQLLHCTASLSFFLSFLSSIETQWTLPRLWCTFKFLLQNFPPPWLICMRTQFSYPDIDSVGRQQDLSWFYLFPSPFFHLNGNVCLAAGTGLLCSCPLGIRPIEEKPRNSFI